MTTEKPTGTCQECKNFVPGGTVPADKDGACVWQEKDIKGGLLWLSRPVRADESCGMFEPK